MAFKVDPRCALGDEIIRAAREQLGEAAQYLRRRGEPVATRVHAGRTTCKRVRAALKLLRGQERESYRRESRRLRNAARKLSALRDAETTLGALRALVKTCVGTRPRRLFAPLIHALNEHRRSEFGSRVKIERTLTRFAERLDAAEARLADWKPKNDLAPAVDNHRRAYKRARAGLVGAQMLGSATAFHEWRKAVKTYGYQCRLLRAAWPPAMKGLRDELKELGVQLGNEHDLTMLRKVLKRLRKEGVLEMGDHPFAAVLKFIDVRRDELRAAAVSVGERLLADRPRVIAERMTHWWHLAAAERAT